MASNQTVNFGLNQWNAEDKVLREEFNADNAKIDAALAAAGNCKIVTGSYVGTGGWGGSHPCTLTFEKKPLLLFLDVGTYHSHNSTQWHPVIFRDATRVGAEDNNTPNVVTWTDTSVSWYYTNNNGTSPTQQFNKADVTYHYIMIFD